MVTEKHYQVLEKHIQNTKMPNDSLMELVVLGESPSHLIVRANIIVSIDGMKYQKIIDKIPLKID